MMAMSTLARDRGVSGCGLRAEGDTMIRNGVKGVRGCREWCLFDDDHARFEDCSRSEQYGSKPLYHFGLEGGE